MYEFSESPTLLSYSLSLEAMSTICPIDNSNLFCSGHIDRIMEAVDRWISDRAKARHESVMIEYCMIADINDSDEVAHELGKLLEDRPVILNVIPYNPTAVPFDYKAPTFDRVNKFKEVVRQYGVKTLLRQELGQDIASACGQLVVTSAGITYPQKDIKDVGDGGSGCGQSGSFSSTSSAASSSPSLSSVAGDIEDMSERKGKSAGGVRKRTSKKGAAEEIEATSNAGQNAQTASLRASLTHTVIALLLIVTFSVLVVYAGMFHF